MANVLESELNYVFGDTLPERNRSLPVTKNIR